MTLASGHTGAPFLSRSFGAACYQIGGVCLPSGQRPSALTEQRVGTGLRLDLGAATPVRSADAVELLSAQIEGATSFVFGHPLWHAWASGKGYFSIRSYLVETAHYLDRAAWRMSPVLQVADVRAQEPFRRHLLEEADHAHYFRSALCHLGVSDSDRYRPLPQTESWTRVMRWCGSGGPIPAAMASGLLESTAHDTAAVTGWHDLISSSGLLPSRAVESIRGHVHEDLSLGHGNLWKTVVRSRPYVTAAELVDGLNAVCVVADAIYQWLDALEVAPLGELIACGIESSSRSMGWYEVPAAVHEVAAGGYHDSSQVVGLGMAELFHRARVGLPQRHAALDRLALAPPRDSSLAEMERFVNHLQRVFAGSILWHDMTDPRSPDSIAVGWVIENYHYLASISRHVSAALASCEDSAVRAWLVAHLADEVGHGAEVAQVLAGSKVGIDVAACRPLPSTLALIQTLTDAATADWAGYCLGLVILQLSITMPRERLDQFYESAGRTQRAAAALAAMQAHDQQDSDLEHSGEARRLLGVLHANRHCGDRQWRSAATIASATWSFLRGADQYDRHGDVSLAARAQWRLSNA